VETSAAKILPNLRP